MNIYRGVNMELTHSISERFQKRFRKLAWLSEYGDLVMLVLLFLVLLYTITWASDKNIYRGVDYLVGNGFDELQSFCEAELDPEDYTLERHEAEILLHLPTDRWFEPSGTKIRSERRIPIQRLARKISELRLFTVPSDRVTSALLTSGRSQDNAIHIQLKIADFTGKNNSTGTQKTENLLRARAKQLSMALNESMVIQDYIFEVDESARKAESAWVEDAHVGTIHGKNELTMLISASISKD